MINWTKEDVEFVVKSMVLPCLEEAIKFDDISREANMKMFNAVAKRVKELDYERQRDKSFFMAFCGQMHNYTQNAMSNIYENYCEEYDRLNKHLLDEIKKTGENND